MASYTYNSGGGDNPVNQAFTGTAGVDSVTAVFGVENISLGARVVSTYRDNADGTFTITFANQLSRDRDSLTITGIENITISTPDRYRWTDGNVYPLATEDEIRTGWGNDTISTHWGMDKIWAGRGDDVIDGGADIDGLGKDFTDRTGAIAIDLLNGTYSGPGSITGIDYFLDLRTGAGNDTIVTSNVTYGGLSQDDVVSGGGGDDVATFLGGRDSFDGGSGEDTLILDVSQVGYRFATTAFEKTASGYTGALTVPKI